MKIRANPLSARLFTEKDHYTAKLTTLFEALLDTTFDITFTRALTLLTSGFVSSLEPGQLHRHYPSFFLSRNHLLFGSRRALESGT
jgi:hypothetical protein